MTKPPYLLYVFWIGVVIGYSQPVQSLTVFRIGGEGLPLPVFEDPTDFVQLSWSDVSAAQHGAVELVTIDSNFIAPLKLNPEVNLVPQLEKEGGQVQALTWIGWGPANGRDEAMFDGDPTTAFLGDGDWGGDYGVIQQKSLAFDMGGRFLLERIRFYPRLRFANDRFVQRFLVGINDGDPLKVGTRPFTRGIRGSDLDFDIIYDVTENTESVIDLPLPSVPVQQLLFEAPENTQGIWEIAEFEIYGNGYAPFSNYVSNVIDLGGLASLGELSWEGTLDSGAQVELSMRSGSDEDPNLYWRSTFRGSERTRFDARGRPLTRSSYNKLQRGEQAGLTHDTENWAFWGAAYDFSKSRGRMIGDGPQRYVQLRADFSSNAVASSTLNYVQFSVSIPPIATGALAEIVPNRAPPGQITDFTYKIRPKLQSGDLGFDSIEIDTPTRVRNINEVRISGEPIAFDVISQEEQSFVIRFSHIGVQRTEELIEVDFEAEVFQFGTVFSGRLSNSEKPEEVPQSVTAGDADVLEDSDRLSVDLNRFGEKNIGSISIESAVFTPNGDGVNDVVGINFEMLNLAGAVPVQAEVYDLSGRSFGVVWSKALSSGRHVAEWNGRNSRGLLVAPGVYVLSLRVEADKGTNTEQAILSVVY